MMRHDHDWPSFFRVPYFETNLNWSNNPFHVSLPRSELNQRQHWPDMVYCARVSCARLCYCPSLSIWKTSITKKWSWCLNILILRYPPKFEIQGMLQIRHAMATSSPSFQKSGPLGQKAVAFVEMLKFFEVHTNYFHHVLIFLTQTLVLWLVRVALKPVPCGREGWHLLFAEYKYNTETKHILCIYIYILTTITKQGYSIHFTWSETWHSTLPHLPQACSQSLHARGGQWETSLNNKHGNITTMQAP